MACPALDLASFPALRLVMPTASRTAHFPLQTAHPHQIGLQDFAAYSLIVDARSAARFAEDHIPGAVTIPMVARGRRALLPGRLGALIEPLAPGSALLLYAATGDRVLAEWATSLRDKGFEVDVLAGGWRNYRRWVEASLEFMPRMFAIRVVLVPRNCDAAQAVKDVLRASGEQVLDLAECEQAEEPRLAVDSWLLDSLRHRETDRALWVFEPAETTDRVTLPASMKEALLAAPRSTLSSKASGPHDAANEVLRLLDSLTGQSKP